MPNAASNVLAWTVQAPNAVEEDAAADVDEPPDLIVHQPDVISEPGNRYTFIKTFVYRPKEHTESLLTRAFQSQSEDETATHGFDVIQRRRSITSDASIASTMGFTSDTGITTPPRTNSPSPRLADLGFASVFLRQRDGYESSRKSPLHLHNTASKPSHQIGSTVNSTKESLVQAQRQCCISFACAPVGHSQTYAPATPAPKSALAPDVTPKAAFAQLANPTKQMESGHSEAPPQPKRPSIRFACTSRPIAHTNQLMLSTYQTGSPNTRHSPPKKHSSPPELKSATFGRRVLRASSSGCSPRLLSTTSRLPSPNSTAMRRTKYYNADPSDLHGESSRFHEFASDGPLEDDWIRQDETVIKQRLTINDTLKKELAIRRLGKEAEEEAEQEDENDDDDIDDVDEDGDGRALDKDGGNEDSTDDGESDDDFRDGDENEPLYSDSASDGYNTDNEVGFASSDDDDDGLILWTVNRPFHTQRQQNNDTDHSTLQNGSPMFRRLSIDEHSDSSMFTSRHGISQELPKNNDSAYTSRRPSTPELPDSTDFVCGTFDEDRPLEEAYVSHMEARKHEKLRVIPQDIDPSFPTSDPEDDSENDSKRKRHIRQQKQMLRGSADEHFWEFDTFHDQEIRSCKSRKKGASPKRYYSPPPPKARGRSSAPRRMTTVRIAVSSQADDLAPRPLAADRPTTDQLATSHTFTGLAFHPASTHTTKSLPRPSAIFRHYQHQHQQPIQSLRIPRCQQQLQFGQLQAKSSRRSKPHTCASQKQAGHVRGAIDISKGLEQKRQRRKETYQQKHCNRARKGQIAERRPRRGEGAVRMREIGLLMAGKAGQGNYVSSI